MCDQHFTNLNGLLCRVAAIDSRGFDDICDAKVIEFALPLLEKENELVSGTVMVAHANFLFVPNNWLPKLEPGRLRDGFGNEHRFCITV